MSSRVIPKEQLTAYQRWELAAVEDVAVAGEADRPASEGGGKDTLQLSLPTAEQLERIHQEAWREGHELGMKEGREAGFQEGLRAGQEHLQRLDKLLEALEVQRLLQEEAIAKEVLNLALAVARQIVRSTVSVKQGIILAAIREAFANLPTFSSHLRVAVHPADAEEVRSWLASEHGHISCKVQEDSALERGSFRFENDHSILHGELPARWREVVSCLGSDLEWLE
jgi:flagellar assembly protein FliH